MMYSLANAAMTVILGYAFSRIALGINQEKALANWKECVILWSFPVLEVVGVVAKDHR